MFYYFILLFYSFLLSIYITIKMNGNHKDFFFLLKRVSKNMKMNHSESLIFIFLSRYSQFWGYFWC